MVGRKILEEGDPILMYFNHPDSIKRRKIFKETLEAFSKTDALEHYHLLASQNLVRWKSKNKRTTINNKIQVIPGDWGEVTHMLTKKHRECFAVLNMANAYVPGGGYIEGASAQEENIFRRTDCHFHITSKEYDRVKDRYTQEMTDLLSAKDGRVYLDTNYPRVCVRAREERLKDDLGYAWLKKDEIFPFYELRAAAQDLRGNEKFDTNEARKRIAAQLDTLQTNNIRYAVLGAIGCGAFLNPPDKVAKIYKEEILKRIEHFDLIVFAILANGYKSENYVVFSKVFEDL